MKAQDLPEEYKQYELVLTDKSKYTITGAQKERILRSPNNFIELANGTLINKVYIVAIRFEKQETVEKFQALPDTEKTKVTSQMTHEPH